MAKRFTILLLSLGIGGSLFAESPTLEEIRLAEEVQRLEEQVQKFSAEYARLQEKANRLESRATALPSICQGRLTNVSGVPVSPKNIAVNSTIYFTPYKGNYVSVYTTPNNLWKLFRFTEVSLALSGTATNNTYDVFLYRGNLGALTLELSAAWTNRWARADALTQLNGVWVKNSDNTRRYLGTIRIGGTANQYADTDTDRAIWNYYNRVRRSMRVFDTSNTWNYNTNAWRQAQADTGNDVSFVIGINEVLVTARVKTNSISNNATAKNYSIGVGMNTTTVSHAQLMGSNGNPSSEPASQNWAMYSGYPGVGYHTLSWVENAVAGARVVNWGDNNAPLQTRSGPITFIEG